MAYDRLIAAWNANTIDEVDFVHIDDVAVFEGCKLAVPYSLLVDIAATASQRFNVVLASPMTADLSSEALNCTLAILTVNGNNYAAWNARKAAVAVNALPEWESELAVTAALLSKHSKSACGWSHRYVTRCNTYHVLSCSIVCIVWFDLMRVYRRWVLQQLFPTTSPAPLPPSEFEREWQLCELAAERYPKNYYAWSHRVWLWQTYGHNRLDLAQADLRKTRTWTAAHLADYSGYHHEYGMTTALLEAGLGLEGMLAEVQAHLEYYEQRVDDYPNHEAMQQHLRRLVALQVRLTPT